MNDSEELRKRANDVPDKWTIEWIRKQFQEVLTAYRGVSHGLNGAMALYDETEALRKRCDSLEREREDDRAKIGEQQARIVELETRVGRMAEFLNSQRKNGSKDPNL